MEHACARYGMAYPIFAEKDTTIFAKFTRHTVLLFKSPHASAVY